MDVASTVVLNLFLSVSQRIDFYYDRISYHTILVNVIMRHFVIQPIGVERKNTQETAITVLH